MVDQRVKYIKVMWAEGYIKTFADVFKYIPRTVVAKELWGRNNRRNHLLDHPEDMAVDDIRKVSDLFKIPLVQTIKLIRAKR